MARGPLFLSVITFILGTCGLGFALYIIIAEKELQPTYFMQDKAPSQHVLHMNLDTKIINTVTGIILILSALAMGFSILLFVGVRKQISGFVIAYFSYGSMLTIILFLTGLLEFLQSYWYLGVITILITGIYVYCLHVVYNEYNVMEKGGALGTDVHALLINEEPLSTDQI